MFKVQNTILSDEIATTKFKCDVSRCKGACCVVGNAGAPISRDEIPDLKKSYDLLKDELRNEARQTVKQQGLVKGNEDEGYRINCTDGEECVFVTYDDNGVAKCAIQKAFHEGRLNWEKPLSCHLFPVRLKRIFDFEYANFEYFPSVCAAGYRHGEKEGTDLSEFLKKPLIRRYGKEWYLEFVQSCREVRQEKQKEVAEAC